MSHHLPRSITFYFFVSTYWIHPGLAATLSFEALYEPVAASIDTDKPSGAPTRGPSFAPTSKPSLKPTATPTSTSKPSLKPTATPTSRPTLYPTLSASAQQALQAQISREGDAISQLVSALPALITALGLWKALTATALHLWSWLQLPASIFVSLCLIKWIANETIMSFNVTVHINNLL